MPTLSKSLGLILTVLLVAAGGAVAGVITARAFKSWERSRAEESLATSVTQLLNDSLREIAVGMEFPDIPLWSSDGRKPVLIRDLLPSGGLIYYIVLECESCWEPLTELDRLASSSQFAGIDVLVIAVGEADRAQTLISETELTLPVILDMQKTLAVDYGVVAFPSYFCLDSNQVVRSLGAEVRSNDRLAEVLSVCTVEEAAKSERR